MSASLVRRCWAVILHKFVSRPVHSMADCYFFLCGWLVLALVAIGCTNWPFTVVGILDILLVTVEINRSDRESDGLQ